MNFFVVMTISLVQHGNRQDPLTFAGHIQATAESDCYIEALRLTKLQHRKRLDRADSPDVVVDFYTNRLVGENPNA